MTGATKDCTVREKCAGLIRRKARFACSAFVDLDVEIEFTAMKPMRHIGALDYKHYWLAFLEGDLGW
jgi:hypothetical protein